MEWFYKLLAEQKKKNLYICDGKNDRCPELCKGIYLRIVKMLWSDSHKLAETWFIKD